MSKQTGERVVEFVQLREDEYESFVSSHALGGYLQSRAAAKHHVLSGRKTHFVGVRDKQGNVIAAAMLTSRQTLRRLVEFDAAGGPVMDYDDDALVKFFFAQLRRFLRRQNAVRLRVSPPIAANHRDRESNVIADGYDGSKYVRLMQEQGFVHVDAETPGASGSLPRWYAHKDMRPYDTPEALFASLDRQTRWGIKKALGLGVRVKRLDTDDIDEFYEVLGRHVDEETAARNKDYYERLAKAYGDDALFLVAQLDLAQYEAIVTQQLVDATAIITDINPRTRSKVKKRQLIAARRNASLCAAKLANINILQRDGDIATIGAAVFIKSAGELVYVGGRSHETYVSFGASYALQWYGQLYALDNGIPRINYAVTRGIFSGDPRRHGAYRFKKGFGAVIEERIGHFEIYPYASVSNRLVLGRSGRDSTNRTHVLKNAAREASGPAFSPATAS